MLKQAYTSEIGAKLVVLSLPRVGPARARWLLGEGTAEQAIQRLRQKDLSSFSNPPIGVTRSIVASWCSHSQKVDGEMLFETEAQDGDQIIDSSNLRWPFTDDPEPPLVVFARGDVALLGAKKTVAIVGTRRCTSIGRRVAYQIGAELAAAGITVVSGLAAGIDVAAHSGALEVQGDALAVAGTGLDVPYPRSNRSLWNEIGERGLLITEAPKGSKPERWRFPARNRLIAGLVDAVVVVESHASGGALLTVDEAILRGCPVFSVPGSVVSSASAGTNRLLAEGSEIALDAQCIITALGFADHSLPDPRSGLREASRPANRAHDSVHSIVLAELAAGPVHLDQLIQRLGLHPVEVLGVIRQLEADGDLEIDGSTAALPGSAGPRRRR